MDPITSLLACISAAWIGIMIVVGLIANAGL